MQTAIVKIHIGRLGINKFVRTKSPTGSKFSEIFEPLYAGWTVVVHLCCSFSLWRQLAPQESAKFRTAFFGQFRTGLRKYSVANYASIWTSFSTSVTGRDILSNALNCRWRHKISKIAVKSLQSVNNRTQRLREILRMVIIGTVINTILGRLTLDPAGVRCPSWDDAFVSSHTYSRRA